MYLKAIKNRMYERLVFYYDKHLVFSIDHAHAKQLLSIWDVLEGFVSGAIPPGYKTSNVEIRIINTYPVLFAFGFLQIGRTKANYLLGCKARIEAFVESSAEIKASIANRFDQAGLFTKK